MSEVVSTGKPILKKKGTSNVKPTENQQKIDIEAQEFQESLRKQREELTATDETPFEVEQTEEEFAPSHYLEGEVLPASGKFTLTADELSKIIASAQGVTVEQHLALRMPSDLKGIDKAGYVVDDALGEVGRGLHRVADGCRDILGGAIDIATLGRANRK